MKSTFSSSNRRNLEDSRKILAGLASEFDQGILVTLLGHTIIG